MFRMSPRKLPGLISSSSTKQSNGAGPSVGTTRKPELEICIVEKILKKRVIDGRVRYLVKWLGYDSPEENTWEKPSSLNCDDLIQQFEEKHAEMSDDDPNDLEETPITARNNHKDAQAKTKPTPPFPSKSSKENKTPKTSEKRREQGTASQKKSAKSMRVEEELPKMINGKRAYEVEAVVNKRVDVNGGVQYKIKWKGYKTQSWEPVENLLCKDLIKKFEHTLDRAKSRSRSIQPPADTTTPINIYKPLRSRGSSVVSPQEPSAKRVRPSFSNTSSGELINFITPKSNNTERNNVENGSTSNVSTREYYSRRAKSLVNSDSERSSVSIAVSSSSTKLLVCSSTKREFIIWLSTTRELCAAASPLAKKFPL
ncbi:chromo (CHRromatin organization MOdifier) domain-containing protein [Ditylenchus destructor]|uniref:Chromo (CHRromatin organization MOdifier) domain-containing protein n=1 Tax=Ditylenchus destructor TaxID=166010 RepID=A0AAD4NIC8_9BILA|nr:chromo (CHRromatin organization MOdifier) domain-containing protein [Ditylenchus destructor]